MSFSVDNNSSERESTIQWHTVVDVNLHLTIIHFSICAVDGGVSNCDEKITKTKKYLPKITNG